MHNYNCESSVTTLQCSHGHGPCTPLYLLIYIETNSLKQIKITMSSVIHSFVRHAVMSEDKNLLLMTMDDGLFDVHATYLFEERDQTDIAKDGTILHFACLKIKPTAVRILLDMEGRFVAEMYTGITELYDCVSLYNTMPFEASGAKILQIISLLLNNGIHPVFLSTQFHDAIQRSMYSFVDFLIENHDFFQHPSNFEVNPFASLHHDKEYPIQMLESLMHMNFNERDVQGKTALYSVIEHIDKMYGPYAFTTVKMLLERGADPNARCDATNLTPFSLAVKWNETMSHASANFHFRIGELLLKYGARFEVPDVTDQSKTPAVQRQLYGRYRGGIASESSSVAHYGAWDMTNEREINIIQRQTDWYDKVRRALDPRLALATSMHPRLGQNSLFGHLPEDVHRMIFSGVD